MEDRINIQEYLAMIRSRKRIIISIVLLSLVLGGFRMYRNYVSYVPKYTSVIRVKIDTMKVQKEKAAKEREKSSKNENKNTQDNENSSDGNNQIGDRNSQNSTFFNYSTIAQDEAIASRYYNYATDSAIYSKIAQVAGVRASKVESISAVQNEEKPEEIKITVTSSDAKSAQMIAAAIPEVYGDILLREVGIDCVSVVYDATSGAVIPRKIDTSVPVCGLLGVAIAIFVVLLLEILNTKIITPDDVEKYWELPLLGVVPEFEDVPYKRGERGNVSNEKIANINAKKANERNDAKKANERNDAKKVNERNDSKKANERNASNAKEANSKNVPHTEGSQIGPHTDKNNGK